MGVEAAVTTCRICSRADRPPPTWKATWSALFCWGEDREGDGVKQRYSQGTTSYRLDRGITWLSPQRESLFLLQRRGIEMWKSDPLSIPVQSQKCTTRLRPAAVKFQWKANALQAPVNDRVVLADDQRLKWNGENATRPKKKRANKGNLKSRQQFY